MGVDSLANRHPAPLEAPLSAQVVSLSLVLLSVTAPSQQSNLPQRVQGGTWSPTIVKPEPLTFQFAGVSSSSH
jgi:hypothetical protein